MAVVRPRIFFFLLSLLVATAASEGKKRAMNRCARIKAAKAPRRCLLYASNDTLASSGSEARTVERRIRFQRVPKEGANVGNLVDDVTGVACCRFFSSFLSLFFRIPLSLSVCLPSSKGHLPRGFHQEQDGHLVLRNGEA